MRPRAAVLFVVLACLSSVSVSNVQDDFPVPLIEALHPKGLRMSIPDSDGIERVAFHANVNKPLLDLEAGQISVDVTAARGGRWTHHKRNIRLKPGDVINYWVWVKENGEGYNLENRSFKITELVNPDTGLPHQTTGDRAYGPVSLKIDRE